MSDSTVKQAAFTIGYKCIVPRLFSSVTAISGGIEYPTKAQWDTGADKTCISHQVVEKLSLSPIGKALICTPSGRKFVNTYCIDFKLPNDVTIKDVSVNDSDIGDQGLDVLIGMNIITYGDFAISNYDGKTVFSFRVPSQKLTDYVAVIKAKKAIGVLHGKGKRKHK